MSEFPPKLLIVEQHHALFSHLADGTARALAADAGVLHAAVGELIGAPSGRAIEDDAASTQAPHCADCQLNRGRENPGLQPEAAAAHRAEHVGDIATIG